MLWASLTEKLWSEVEKVCGWKAVRWHRASINLTKEKESDRYETKQIKRKAALRYFKYSAIFSVVVPGLIIAVFCDTLEEMYRMFLGFLSFIPSAVCAVTFVQSILPELLQSRGTKYLKQVQAFEKHKRPNFSQKTGFMGEVKQEIQYLFDFLRMTYYSDNKLKKRLPVHLAVFVDDLDRCEKSTVMEVLQASILLLVDSPITCWMAIDTRRVVTSINDHFGKNFTDVGVDGYLYLEKIIQLPFCLPSLTIEAKKSYMLKMLEGKELSSQRVYQRLKSISEGSNRDAISGIFDSSTCPTIKTEDEATSTLIPVLQKWFQTIYFRMIPGLVISRN